MKKRKREPKAKAVPELPEAKPMPGEASPGGIEGAESSWQGGPSEPILGPEPDFDTTYSTADMGDAPRVEVVRFHRCDECGQTFATESLLNTHRRTTHGHAERHS
jgi:Zinc finger, C2H2 type